MTEAVLEEWRYVPGFGQRYAVSNLGRIKSYLRKGRIMKTPLNSTRVPRLNLRRNGKSVQMTVKSVKALAFPEGV